MATPLPAPNCAKVTFHLHDTVSTRDVSWAHEIHYAGTWSASDAATLLPNFATAWTSHLKAVSSTNIGLVDVEMIDLADPTHAAVTDTINQAGTDATQALPLSVTAELYWPVASRIRGGRSHTFLTGFCVDDLAATEDTWTAGMIAAMAAYAAAIQNAVTAVPATMGALELGVVHRHRSKALLNPPVFEVFTGVQERASVRSRSRRLPRHFA